jgi:hypothetical protein
LVIHQWLVVLRAVHPNYQFFVGPEYHALQLVIDCVCLTDETVLDHD